MHSVAPMLHEKPVPRILSIQNIWFWVLIYQGKGGDGGWFATMQEKERELESKREGKSCRI